MGASAPIPGTTKRIVGLSTIYPRPLWQNRFWIPGGRWPNAQLPTETPTLSPAHPICVHRGSPSPAPKALCSTARRYPGSVSENRNNRNAVVPRQRTAGSFCTGWVVVIQTTRGVARSDASGHVPPTSPDGAAAQPFQGCFVIGHLPMVAPRRCNHGLCGRIPLGFPDGKWRPGNRTTTGCRLSQRTHTHLLPPRVPRAKGNFHPEPQRTRRARILFLLRVSFFSA